MSSELQERTPTDSTRRIDEASLDTIFRSARTSSAWLDKPIPEGLIRELYDLVKLGPTSANLTPGRFVFVTSPEAKERLLPAMNPGNVEKTRTAPTTAIVAYDTEFFERAPYLFPLADMKQHFENKPDVAKRFGELNAGLQTAYLIIAARALGLAAGPMAGFDGAAIDKEFFPDGKWKTLLVVNLGYPDPSVSFDRLPRLEFEEAARIE